MPTSPRAPGRHTLRLPGYDYAAPGAYFVTISVHDRRRLFGHVARGRLCTNAAGVTVEEAWDALPDRFPGVALDAFVVMPDHVHGILWIEGPGPGAPPPGDVRAPLVGARREPTIADAGPDSIIAGAHEGRPSGTHAPVRAPLVGARRESAAPPTPTLGDIVGAFKSITTVAYFAGVRTAGWPRVDRRLWQRNYYERIVRGPDALGAVRRYIARNPARWVAKHRGRH